MVKGLRCGINESSPNTYGSVSPGVWCKSEGEFKTLLLKGGIAGPVLQGKGKYETILHSDFFRKVLPVELRELTIAGDNNWNAWYSPVRIYEGVFKDGKMVEQEKVVFWKHSDNFEDLCPRFDLPELDPFILPEHVGTVDEVDDIGKKHKQFLS